MTSQSSFVDFIEYIYIYIWPRVRLVCLIDSMFTDSIEDLHHKFKDCEWLDALVLVFGFSRASIVHVLTHQENSPACWPQSDTEFAYDESSHESLFWGHTETWL